MREYRKLKQEEQKKLKEDLKHKSEIIEQKTEKQIGKQPTNIERIIEKAPRIIKEPPDYNIFSEEILLKEMHKRQENVKEHRLIKQQETFKTLTMNIE